MGISRVHSSKAWTPVVVVYNTNRKLMDVLLHEFGGFVCTGRTAGKKAQYCWHMNRKEQRLWLPLVQEYAVIKSRQLGVILQFLSIALENRSQTGKTQVSMTKKYERMKARIQHFNGRSA